jgi:hypothetical protein
MPEWLAARKDLPGRTAEWWNRRMRLLFLLMLLGGIAGAIAYPWMASDLGVSEVGSFRVFDPESGFRPAVVRLSAQDSPIRVLVELTAARPLEVAADEAVITLTVAAGSRTVLAQTLTFAEASPRETSPQLSDRIYRQQAGTIDPVEDADHTFTVGPAGMEAVDIRSIDVVLASAPAAIDPRVQPIGFALMAIGFVGLVLSLRRGRNRPPENPNSQPPKPRWGRGAEPR